MSLGSRFATAVIMEITYGHRIETDDDPYLRLAKDVDRLLNGAGSAGASVVDFFPFRKLLLSLLASPRNRLTESLVRHLPVWFPGAWFIRYGKGWYLHSPCFVPAFLILSAFAATENRIVTEVSRDFGYNEVRREMVGSHIELSN